MQELLEHTVRSCMLGNTRSSQAAEAAIKNLNITQYRRVILDTQVKQEPVFPAFHPLGRSNNAVSLSINLSNLSSSSTQLKPPRWK